jgi:arsenite methyltransferase
VFDGPLYFDICGSIGKLVVTMLKKQNAEQVTRYADMLSAMGTEPRLRIMRLLLSAYPHGMIVGEIGSELEIPSSTLSHHLEKLKNEDLVTVRREGTYLWYSANTSALKELLGFLMRNAAPATRPLNRKRSSRSAPKKRMNESDVRDLVRDKYSQAALRAASGESSCCGGQESCCDPITSNLYDAGQKGEVPDEALKASLGCGNPTALAELKPGEIVLDLGSGGGIDVLLSARRVGPTGKAYGLDMTDEMLALAEENKGKSGLTNVEFLKGEIENIPLTENSVDVIISNCVISLSGDKDRVLAEAFRVLRPRGRFAVSDVVVKGAVPAEIRRNMELWVGCVAGALSEEDYTDKLNKAGFENIEIESTRVYEIEDARSFLSGRGIDVDAAARQVQGKFRSAFIRATKPSMQVMPRER